MNLKVFFGDARLQMDMGQRTQAALEPGLAGHDRGLCNFRVDVPFRNVGSQELTILDAWARVYLPDEQYNGLHLTARVNYVDRLRDDDYFEAMLVPAGKIGTLVLRFTAADRTGTDIGSCLQACPDVDVAVYCELRGRGAVYIDKQIFTLTMAELAALRQGGA